MKKARVKCCWNWHCGKKATCKIVLKFSPVVNLNHYLINILQAAFACTDPKSAKKTDDLTLLFAFSWPVFSWPVRIKAACKTLMKLVKVINLYYGFLECRKRVSRISLGCVKWGGVGWVVCGSVCGGWGFWGMIIGDAMIPFSRSQIRDHRFRDHRIRY